MNFKQAKEKIEKIDWYQQGGAVKPLYISYPWHSCSLMKIFGKKITVKYELLINVKNHFMDDYISKRSLEKVGKYYFEKQRKDKKFIFKLVANWRRKFVNPYLKLNREILNEDLSKYTKAEVLGLFEKFTNIYRSVWHEAIFLDSFDYAGDIFLRQAAAAEKKGVKETDLEILLTPPDPSFLQRERLEILRLAEKISENSIGGKEMEKYLKKISSDYYWLRNDFAQTHFLKPEHFKKKAQELLQSKKKMLEEKEMRTTLRNLKEKKRKVKKEHNLSEEFSNILEFLAMLGNFRDERKSYNQMAGNTLRKFAEEFSQRTGIAVNTVEYMFHWEIKHIFNLSRKRIKEIESRPKGWLYFITGPEKFVFVKGKSADKLNNYLKTQVSRETNLRGMPAYAGIARGEVKIIRDQNDFHKMKKGNILVAPNTRPEFLPVIKIASAIVTDEGGLTCHAAIVSRELKIPCVVGVQGVSFVLKDGDRIKVDSTSGIIERIK